MRPDRLLRILSLSLVLSVASVPAGSADDSLQAALQSRYADLKAAIAAGMRSQQSLRRSSSCQGASQRRV
jgi:hypothetical protein